MLLLSHHDILFLDVECHHLLHKHLLLLLNLHHLLLRLKLIRLWGLLIHHLSGGSDSPGRTWVVHLEEVNTFPHRRDIHTNILHFYKIGFILNLHMMNMTTFTPLLNLTSGHH